MRRSHTVLGLTAAFSMLIAMALTSTAPAATSSAKRQVTVSASQVWTDTGFDVSGKVTLHPSGTIEVGGPEPNLPPAGSRTCKATSQYSRRWAAPGFPCWSLIARVSKRPAFFVGSGGTFSVPSGRLFLGVNDEIDSWGDNSGGWPVTVETEPISVPPQPPEWSNGWSGYVVRGATFTQVSGRWVVRPVTCSRPDAVTSFWVGLDGSSSATVEQVGTTARCVNGVPRYYAWWEMYPYVGVPVFAVQPGAEIFASVTYRPARPHFRLALRNNSTGQHFTRFEDCPAGYKCARSSAEWVVERPGHDTSPLANFGRHCFNATYVMTKRHRGTITDSAWSHVDVLMVSRGRVGWVRAMTSQLARDGTGFCVNWMHE